MTDLEAEAMLDVYDDLAVEIVDENLKNTAACLDFTNRELAENICQAMGWDDFDLLSYYDFEAVKIGGTVEVVLAYAFISFLRWRLFRAALEQDIGDPQINQRLIAYTEYWYIALVHRWNELSKGPKMAAWIN